MVVLNDNELEQLEESIKKSGMPKEALEKANSELKKLKLMPPMSAEATVIRSYLDCMLTVPWKKKDKIQYDLKKAEKMLDKDHYGLEKVKERIIEYLAVQQRVKRLKGPILCLAGPPGVGKTSLAKKGIGSSIYYPHPVPRMSYYKNKYHFSKKKFINASRISDCSIALPVGPHLNKKDMRIIAKNLIKIIKDYSK